MTRVWRDARTGSLILALLVSLLFLAGITIVDTQQAYADGGAPNLAYIAGGGSGANDLVVIDIAKRSVTGHVTVGGAPAGVVLSADGRFAYVTQSAKNSLAIVDARDLHVAATVPVGSQPQVLALDQTETPNVLYIANSGGDTVSVVNPDARKVVATFPVGQHPGGLAIALNGTGIVPQDINDAELYVANTGSDSVTVISTEHRRVLATIPVPGGPVGVVVPQSGGVAYVSLRSGAVAVVSLAKHTLLGTLLPPPPGATTLPGTMDYDAVTGQVYVPEPATGNVVVLAPASAGSGGASPVLPTEPARALSFGGGPSAVAITFDGAYGFVTQRDAGKATMFDVGTHKPLAEIAVGGAPRAVVTGAYPPLLNRQTANVAAYLVTALLVLVLAVSVFFVAHGARRNKRTIKDTSVAEGDEE
ncbi:MAG: YncE family protein [Ktedonobacterales bacterium]